MLRKTSLAIGATAIVASSLIAGGTALADPGKVYTVYLSNNFNGNDWRQQMLHSVQVAATKPPLAGRVTLNINNVETTTQAQINSLNNIIREQPDAILVDAGSGDALTRLIHWREAGVGF
jgi:ribose transport system substrate-binding protein